MDFKGLEGTVAWGLYREGREEGAKEGEGESITGHFPVVVGMLVKNMLKMVAIECPIKHGTQHGLVPRHTSSGKQFMRIRHWVKLVHVF